MKIFRAIVMFDSSLRGKTMEQVFDLASVFFYFPETKIYENKIINNFQCKVSLVRNSDIIVDIIPCYIKSNVIPTVSAENWYNKELRPAIKAKFTHKELYEGVLKEAKDYLQEEIYSYNKIISDCEDQINGYNKILL